VGPRAGLDRRKISSPPGFDPDKHIRGGKFCSHIHKNLPYQIQLLEELNILIPFKRTSHSDTVYFGHSSLNMTIKTFPLWATKLFL